jgi:hypothetical protein
MRLVADRDILHQHMLMNPFGRFLERKRKRPSLVPKRLCGDVEPAALHPRDLTIERRVVEIFGDHDVDGEIERISTTRDQLEWTERGLDLCSTTTAIFLPTVLLPDVDNIDDVDLFAVVEFVFPFFEMTATSGARSVGGIKLVLDFDDRKNRLRCRTVTFLLRSRRRLRVLTATLRRSRVLSVEAALPMLRRRAL